MDMVLAHATTMAEENGDGKCNGGGHGHGFAIVMVLILVMAMVIFSVHFEYRNNTLNVEFRLRNSSGRATTIAAPYSSCSIYN